MSRKLIWLILGILVVFGAVYYFSQPGDGLNVTPEARREIEKAKRR